MPPSDRKSPWGGANGSGLRLLATPLGWTTVSRALLLVAVALPPLLLAFVLCCLAIEQPELVPFADIAALTICRVLLGALVLLDISLFTLGMVLRTQLPDSRLYEGLAALFVALLPLVPGYFLGLLSSGTLALLVLVSALSVVLLSRPAALTGMGAWMGGLLLLTGLEQAGVIPYASALDAAPMGPGGLHPAWVLGPGLLVGGTVLGALLLLDGTVKRERRYLEELHGRAHRDPLTGLPDLRTFTKALGRELDRASRHGIPACVARLTIDRLDEIQRSLGYEVSDRLLQAAGARLGDGLRNSDLLASAGEQGFLLLLSHLDPSQADATSTRLRALVQEPPLDTGSMPLSVTVTVAMAWWQPDESPRELLDRAERTLREAHQPSDSP